MSCRSVIVLVLVPSVRVGFSEFLVLVLVVFSDTKEVSLTFISHWRNCTCRFLRAFSAVLLFVSGGFLFVHSSSVPLPSAPRISRSRLGEK